MVKFRLKNIGLLYDEVVELNNFTLICGQNNTGKTYITYSIYGFLSAWKDLIEFNISNRVLDELYKNGFTTINISMYYKDIKNILKNLSNKYTRNLFNIFSVEEEFFKNSIFEIEIENFELNLSDQFRMSLSSTKKDIIDISKDQNSENLNISILSDEKTKIPSFIIKKAINEALGKIIFGKYFKRPFIITSERSGISLFYKELDISKNVIVEHLTKKNIDPFEIIKETVSRYALPIKHNIDYIRDIEHVTKQKSFLYDDKNINKYFADILYGYYKLMNNELYFIPKKSKSRLPIYFSSSSVKSLLELFFYIKYTAKKGDLLIIDEPELNLHPNNHILLTRLLVYLINQGIDILITTHSDYIVKECNNLIRLNFKLSDKEKILKKYKYKKFDKIDYSRISVYINNFGHLDKVKVTKMGMEIKTFDDVIINLSNAIDDIYFNIEDKNEYI